MRTSIRVLLLVGVAAAAAAIPWFLQDFPHADAERSAPTKSATEQILARMAKAQLPITPPEVRQGALRSLWAEADQKRFAGLLQNHGCEVLVVPMQVVHYGFDRATRSLMTAQLAHAIAADNSHCVVDPYLASRALGDGLRRLSENEVQDLAKAAHVKTMIWIYAGHDNHMKMEIAVRLQRSVSSSMFADAGKKVWSDIAFSDEHPPFDSWQSILPEIVAFAGIDAKPVPPTAATEQMLTLPSAPEQLVAQSSASPLDQAQRFQVLAMLGPVPEFRAIERLFEKSWLLASDVADGPQTRRLRARALYHLGYRPAALGLLAGDDSAESRLLRALLNGNLTEADKLQDTLATPVEKFLAAIEIRDLGLTYGRVKDNEGTPKVLTELSEHSNVWAALLNARLRDLDSWYVGDNLRIKTWLDATDPLPGFSLPELAAASSTLAEDPDRDNIGLLATRHINKLLEQQTDKYCCRSFQLQPGAFDLLELIAARAQANLEKRVYKPLMLQGLPEHALVLLDAYDAEFSGHPHFSVLRAQANMDLFDAAGRTNDTRSAQRVQAWEAAGNSAAYWEQGMTRCSNEAMFGNRVSERFLTDYTMDFPPRPYSASISNLQSDRIFQRALDYDTDSVKVLVDRASVSNPVQRKALLPILDERFAGSPEISQLRMKLAPENRPPDQVLASMREMLAKDPSNWSIYSDIAVKLVEDAKFDDAAELIATYPGFKPSSGENSVELSNDAAGIGSALYWRGAIDPATKLYKIAARYDNGSDSSMMAQQRLAGMTGDYLGYSRIAIQRAQRYEHAWAYRDYLCMLFAMGYAKEAWPAFLKIADRFDNTEVWHAAMVGHRVEGASDEAVRAWLLREPIRTTFIGSDVNSDRPAIRFALTYFMVDRTVPADLAKFLADIEGPPVDTINPGGGVAHPVGKGFRMNPPSDFRVKARTHPVEGTKLASPYVLFAEAYAAQRQGDHAAAVAAFDRLAGSYKIESALPPAFNGGMSFALPYFAMSAAKTDDKLGLKAFLDQIKPEAQGFDYHLAQAVFEGFARHSDKARELLRLAFLERPYTVGRGQLSPYQYAETCIWLFEESGEAQYRDLALDWARNYQRIDPAFAWAYALEARYSPKKDDARTRAIALAEYLDRNSAWLGGVPQADRDAAKLWLKSNNPFVKPIQREPAI
jgi:hypothetical protein